MSKLIDVLYRWVDGIGDEASLETRLSRLAICFSRNGGLIQFLSADQARELAAALLKWAGGAETKTPPGTVRVRLAVYFQGKDYVRVFDQVDKRSKPDAWIEADVPIPQPQTIEGRVVE